MHPIIATRVDVDVLDDDTLLALPTVLVEGEHHIGIDAADPHHPDHEDRMDWYGGSFDAGDMDVKQINKRLAQIAARRHRTAIKARS